MKKQRLTEQFATVYDLAVRLATATDADGLLLLLEAPVDWEKLKRRSGAEKVLIAADTPELVAGASEVGLNAVVLDMAESPVYERLTQALLEAVADDFLAPGSRVVALYSGFEPGRIDSISYLRLDEHLGRLTARDLRQLETRVPLDTLKLVLDLAVEIGREGREGKPVGTMFVVGDVRKVLAESAPSGFDPMKGYSRKERNLSDKRVREGVKEIAQLDGAFIVSPEGIVEKACQILDTSAASITLTKGLGARHWAGAAISKKTKAIAIVVSETNGTVRLFENGEVVLRVEPFRRAMKWTDFEYESPARETE
jgi:DNA integrity scanning protein DisA with diadenylate cyclase activity